MNDETDGKTKTTWYDDEPSYPNDGILRWMVVFYAIATIVTTAAFLMKVW